MPETPMPGRPGDPFASLRRDVPFVDPDPAFAAVLRARIERALALPPGVTVSDITRHTTATSAVATDDDRLRHGDIAYVSLWVPDVARAAAFYTGVLGWELHPDHGGQGRQLVRNTVGHGLFGGQARSTLMLCFAVDDLDAALGAVADGGGWAGAPIVAEHGRRADCVDDQDVPFSLVELGPDPAPRPAVNGTDHGDLSYITAEVVDSGRARRFYGSVLGWRFTPGRIDDGWQVDDVLPMTGLSGGHRRATVVPMYRVDDIASAVERVRDAGGTATDVEQQPYGLSSDCTDDQGTHFYLGQH